MFGLSFIELLGIVILIVLLVKPKDYKTLYIQIKKFQLQFENLEKNIQHEIMLLDEPSKDRNNDTSKEST